MVDDTPSLTVFHPSAVESRNKKINYFQKKKNVEKL